MRTLDKAVKKTLRSALKHNCFIQYLKISLKVFVWFTNCDGPYSKIVTIYFLPFYIRFCATTTSKNSKRISPLKQRKAH